VRNWLQAVAAAGRELSEEAEGYLLGRGMRQETINRLGMFLWHPPDEPAPDEDFRKKYHPYGEYCAGRITCPFYSPRGELLGFEARTWRWEDGKHITDYRLPECDWNPVFIGLTPETMKRVWAGGDVCVVEGMFDLAPLERVVPSKDVVLATVRAKLSDTHVEYLRRYVRPPARVRMVYDNDETGRKQTVGWTDSTGKQRWGALDVLRRVGVSCEDVRYTGGKDPGEVWDSGGEAAVRRAFNTIT